jgi:hypothetical protein
VTIASPKAPSCATATVPFGVSITNTESSCLLQFRGKRRHARANSRRY